MTPIDREYLLRLAKLNAEREPIPIADGRPQWTHWTQPIREDVRGLPSLDLRTYFLTMPNEEQRVVAEDIVRDETRALNFKLFEIDCSGATEATFRGRWILELNKPGVRSYPEWWSDQPTRILIKGISDLTGDAVPALATVVDCEFKREIPCKWMLVFVLTQEDRVPRPVIEYAMPSLKRVYDLREFGWKPGADIRS